MKINNVTVKDPSLEGLTVTDEPVFAPNTGRNLKAKMVGDIVGFKTTLEVTWNVLTFAELYTIKNAVMSGMLNNGGYFEVQYPETTASGNVTNVTKTFYADHIPRTFYSLNAKAQFYRDITISFIEQ